MRCVRCRCPWTPEPRAPGPSRCLGCGAPIRVDAVAVDFLSERAPAYSPGARAMQSRLMARLYGRLWRPVLFGLSTGFGAPGAMDEARQVLRLIAGRRGPWLDVSCGPGGLLREILATPGAPRVFGVDLSRAMLERARVAAPGATLVRADAADLPFEGGTFGAIAHLAALDLYPDPARAVGEAARVLAPGGRWVSSTFVRSAGAAASRWSSTTGVRTPTIEEVADWAGRAGLRRFESRVFRRYAIAWADKD
jgi:SAM-dependent methyltransferase